MMTGKGMDNPFLLHMTTAVFLVDPITTARGKEM